MKTLCSLPHLLWERNIIAPGRAMNNDQGTQKGRRKPSGKGARFFLHLRHHPTTPQAAILLPPYCHAKPVSSLLGPLFIACSWSVEALTSRAL